jgi:hypothetical protein
MQLIQAIAKSAPRQVNTRYGQKTVIDAVGNNGQEITIWRGGDDRSPALNSITNGSRIAVGLDSKGKYSLLEAPADRAAQVVPKPISPVVEPATPMGFHVEVPLEAERRLRSQIAAAKSQPVAIDERIAELGQIYRQCLAVTHGSEAAALAIFQAAIG